MDYRWVVLGISFLSQLSNALAGLSVAPLAPIFQPELGLTKAEVGFFSTAAFAGAWIILLVAGSLTDRFGVRKVMSLGQLATGLLVLCMSAVGSFAQAASVMLLAGIGRGTTGPGITKAIVDWFPTRARASAMGINQAAIPLAGIITASSLPALSLMVGWRSAIAVVGLAILVGGITTAVAYRDPYRPTVRATPKSEIRSSVKEAVGNRQLWVAGTMGAVFSGVQFSLITYLALYFKEVVLVPLIPEESTRIVAAGRYLALCYAGSIFARIFWGVVSDRVFYGRRLGVLAAIGALSMAMSLVVGSLGSGYPLWALSIVVLAYGATAMGWQGLYFVMAAETASSRNAGTGVGLCMTCSQLGFVGVPPLFGFILDTTGSYRAAWLFLGALSGIGTLVATVMARREKQPARSPSVDQQESISSL